MDLGLAGKVALVTAASKGLGKGIALELAKEGANVIISSRSDEHLAKAASEIEAISGHAPHSIKADVSQLADIDHLRSVVLEKYGQVDILINNAGGPPHGHFDDLGDTQWQESLDLLLFSVLRLTRSFLPQMRERGWGRIVNITSISAKQPISGLLLSNAIRPAIIGMTKTLSEEVAADGVTINNILPGWIYTDRNREVDDVTAVRTGRSVEEVRRQVEANIPVGRYGTVQEFAATCAFLVSEHASYITGSSIVIDGGIYKGLM